MHRWRPRQVVNLINLSTPAGVAVALLGGARLHRGPRGLVVACGYRLDVPRAAAFTLGNVVITAHRPGWLEDRPRLLAHEERHASQYAACLGLPMLPLYAAAAAWSWWRSGDWALHNVFERRAGLADGGYHAT